MRTIKLILVCIGLILIMGNGATAQTQGPGEGDAGMPADVPQGLGPGEMAQSEGIKPILDIKKLDNNAGLYSIELRDVELADFFRVIAHDYQMNILVDKNVKGKIFASLRNISIEDALKEIAYMNNLEIAQRNNVLVVKPHLVSKVFSLKYIKAEELLNSGQSATGSGEQPSTGDSSSQSQGSADIYDLLSESGKILLGKNPNSIMVIDAPEKVEEIGKYLEMIDWGMESRIFKLNYLKAEDVAGKSSSSSAGGETAETEAAEPAASE
ncbi:MAG: secretin and TonB N-terminal domain-containing protein [Candidatus Omnitrophica bacterium]|nr:secretin and TonB N-terminal domain-containing protein [Candidatus Omnitrophota bacterium]